MKKIMLTDNIEATVTAGPVGACVTILGGHSEHGPHGWALVIGDRVNARDLECRIQASSNYATVTLNGPNMLATMVECVLEVAS